jgi:DNA-binding MarR family transcriptional regulator
MKPRPRTADDAAPAGLAAGGVAEGGDAQGEVAHEDRDEKAARVWEFLRGFALSYPPKNALRDALDLGRGSGRVQALLRLTMGPLSLSKLAEAVKVDPPYATLIVDTLEERGFVERRPDPADRRRKLVAVTPAGEEAAERVRRIMRNPPPGFAALTPDELDVLEKLLHRAAGDALLPARPDGN